MAIELDAEQIRNMRKAGMTPEDAIDFPVSPDFASFYASQGMTRDYPPEYYQNQGSARLTAQLEELESRIAELEGKKAVIKYIMPIKPPEKKQAPVPQKSGVSLRVKK